MFKQENVGDRKQSRQRKAVTYAAPPGNGLPIQRNYGIAPGNEKHQPVSTNTSCLNIHLFSISNVDADADFHSNVDADSNVDIDAD